MKSKANTTKPTKNNRQDQGFKKRRGLRFQMMLSYVGVSVATALLLELLLILLFFLVILRLPFVDQNTTNDAQHISRVYALEAAVQANGGVLNPQSTFQPGQPFSLVLQTTDSPTSIPYTTTRPSSSQEIAFALLIAPNGQVLASSYPALYPTSMDAAHLLPAQAKLIRGALVGKADNTVAITPQGHILSVVQPVLNSENKPIGAIYLQMPPV
ncbi:MAG TPA: hypothetical protein VJ761_20375, partial [Ktedonobacteraceae bacterium]|nr:hypothetical protein [Ktedonobacteraceae bacterium]